MTELIPRERMAGWQIEDASPRQRLFADYERVPQSPWRIHWLLSGGPDSQAVGG